MSGAAEHAMEVGELWAAYGRRENRRVPIIFACDEQLWLKVAGHRFGEFYARPEMHLDVQLQGRRWFLENVAHDGASGLPERWAVGVQLWMTENEFYGCEVVYQDDDYAWAKPLPYGRDDLFHYLADLDPDTQILQSHTYRMYQALKELAADRRYLDRPMDVAMPGGGTHGILTKAAEIRGIEQLCLDLYEAPEFAERFLHLVTEKTIERIRAWHRLTQGAEPSLPAAGGYSTPDDSLQLISAKTYERFVLPCHERLYSTMATGPRSMHLCGHSWQHYEVLHRRLGISGIDGPGPFVDHGHYLRLLGPDFWFQAQTDHSILAQGSAADIERMMHGLLTPSAKLTGRFQVMGFVTRDTPLENVRACYEAGRRLGAIEGAGV